MVGVCTFTQLPSPLPANHHIWYGQAPSDEKRKDTAKLPLNTDVSSNHVDDATLGEDSLFEVMSELTDVTNWRMLGFALGLKPSTLDKIKIEHREKVDDCKFDMLVCWLQMQDNVTNIGYPSWRTLVIALKTPVVHCSDIAHGIAHKYPK